MPQTPPQRPPRSGAGAFTLLAVLAFLALAAFILMRRETVPVAEAPTLTTMTAPASPAMPSEPPPSALPEASPEPSPAASAEPASPAPAAAGEPRPRRRAAAPNAGTRVADAGVAPNNLPPLPPPPTSGGGRRFVLGATSVESLKPVARTMPGFEASGVGVKRAPQVNGRVVLEMDPPQVRPGVDYTVKVYLANDGDQDIPVQGLTVVTLEDGKRTSRTPPSAARTVKPKQRVLVHEVTGVWREAAKTWSMEATVTSAKQDVYRNRLSWE
jgi:hypothetical protein